MSVTTTSTANVQTYEQHLKQVVIAPIMSAIDKIASLNMDPHKSESTKQAEACFTFLGMSINDKCEHGIPAYACMPCSH